MCGSVGKGVVELQLKARYDSTSVQRTITIQLLAMMLEPLPRERATTGTPVGKSH